MFLNPILKGFTLITRLVIGLLMIVVLTISNAAIAVPIFQDGLDIGLTAFYPNPEGQSQKIQALGQIKQPTDNKEQVYTIAVPLSFPPSGLGDGSFQQADLDFSSAMPSVPDTAARISFTGPIQQTQDKDGKTVNETGKLYSVVAGINLDVCPVAIRDTQIAFFDTPEEASDKAKVLFNQGYLVYVTNNKEVQDATIAKIKCKPEIGKVLVTGQTKKVTVDFKDVYTLLPSALQPTAKNSTFVYTPKEKDGTIYLVNARALYTPSNYQQK